MSEVPAKRPTTEDIERLFLGPPARYTRLQVAEAAGVPSELAARIWRALGFAAPADDAVAFSDADVDALRRIGVLLDAGLLDEKIVVRMARALGQTTARLAQWQAEIVLDSLADAGDGELGRLLETAGLLLPDFERLLVHVWRVQLAAVATRLSASAELVADPSSARITLAVGFADLVAFTRYSRDLDSSALAELVEGFESRASDVVAARGGRLVKALGDEVLFTAGDPATAAGIALDLADAARANADGPDVRVGLAYGPILPTMGDVFGPTVNLAARLTAIARPGTIIIDSGMADGLTGVPGLEISKIRRRPARGFGVIQPYVLRARTPDEEHVGKPAGKPVAQAGEGAR
ncbi:adenylate/guanylate cyclase domain-containing protein [Thermopolyspora sp. NPDC052614]|uniref:adenylate/guanylate cyclase domain-containing protein n=1 Tax=Thermopolyspora sp. NPDC052614 TaxID=3155682 RepID=UPI0034419D35